MREISKAWKCILLFIFVYLMIGSSIVSHAQKNSTEELVQAFGTVAAQGKCGEELTWKLDDSGIMIVGGNGAMWDFTIEGENLPWKDYKDKICKIVFMDGVTSVGVFAFRECQNLQQVIFGKSVTTLGDFSFYNCQKLKDVDLPNNIERIEGGAFEQCSALEEVVIPQSLTYIGGYAWSNCEALKRVYISNVSNLELTASPCFSGCRALESIEVMDDCTQYMDIDGVLFTKDGKILCYPEGKKDKIYEIPYGTTSIAGYCFATTYLQELVIPETVVYADNMGIWGNSYLEKIVNKSTLDIKIDDLTSCFWCDEAGNKVDNIVLANSTVYKHVYLRDIKLMDNSETTQMAVGEIQEVRYQPIFEQDGWYIEKDDVTFASSDSSIASVSEAGIVTAHKVGVAEISLSPKYPSEFWISDTASYTIDVRNTEDMTQITLDNVIFTLNDDGTASILNGQYCATDYEIPTQISCGERSFTVTSVGTEAFKGNKQIKRLKVPETIETIEYYAFSDCVALEEVILSFGLEELAEGSFLGCNSLKEIVVPESVKCIGQCAFSYSALQEFYVHATVTDFHIFALSNIATLECIMVDGENEFYASKDGVLYSKDFTEIVFYPEGKKDEAYAIDERTTKTPKWAMTFANNKYLKKLIFPAGFMAEAIRPAMMSRNVIEEFEVAENSTEFNVVDGVLYSKDGKALYLYPAGKKDKIFFIPSGVEHIGNGANYPFEHTQYLEELYVPASVQDFDAMLWYGASLKKVIFAANCQIEQIGAACFQGCMVLESICLPASIKTLSATMDYGNEFLDCDNMCSLYVAQGAPFYTKGTFGTQTLTCCNAVIYGYGDKNVLSMMAKRFDKEYVDVSGGFDKVLGITFADTFIKLDIGESKDSGAVVYPEITTAKKVIYSSSDNAVATVSEEGMVLGVADGICYITATATDGSGEYARCQIYVGDGIKKQPQNKPTQAPVVTPIPEEGITLLQGNDGNWYFYVNGVYDPNYTGLAPLGENWWMVVNGTIDFTYTSAVFFDDNWWFVRDGMVEFDYNGLVFVNDDWWYVVNGKIDFGFNGLAYVNNAWWYVSTGRIDFSYTGLIFFDDDWWFVQNGCVNFGYTGLAFINNDWWYVVNGRIDFAYCGLFDYDNEKWYVQGGKIDFSYNNVYYFNDIWWYIETGKVNFQYNGLAYTQFNDKWWYVINGVISFDYTGAAYANDKYWYVERGEIDFQRNGKVIIDGVEKTVAWGEILM
ncbi:MAG: hypothetical protein E7287_11100 [Lachnospiraceae bacterium]|nr:hypothetical protein [Lachnospiraceae bacterium]